MTVQIHLLALIPLVVVIYYAVRLIDERVRRWLGKDLSTGLQQQLDEHKALHEAQLTALRAEYDQRIAWLLDQLKTAAARIKELETQVAAPQWDPHALCKPLLLICGDDPGLSTIDRVAIRRAGVPFHRISDATKEKIDDELRRRRQDGTLYTWVHFSGHTNQAGAQLTDGPATPDWWNETLLGIHVLFLAACTSVTIADDLAGMMTVVYTTEDINNKDAANFTYMFWRQMQEHGNPGRAYQEALLAVPQVAEFTDIRLGGDDL